MTPSIDVRWDVGLPGWMVDGRHVRLADVIEADPGKAASRIATHRAAVTHVALAHEKLADELAEVLGG